MVDIDGYMRAHNQLSGIESNLTSPCASSASISSSTSSDEEETIALPAGLMSDEQVSAASDGQTPFTDMSCLEYKANMFDIPAVMSYDFCNAFPTLLHEWMWLVLNVLRIPKPILKVIGCLYISITAYPSGIGDGSFLFEVFAGVRTGCPLSSILFLLCCNPCIFLMNLISDGPKFQ